MQYESKSHCLSCSFLCDFVDTVYSSAVLLIQKHSIVYDTVVTFIFYQRVQFCTSVLDV